MAHFVKAKGILSSKNGMNLYRGCQHGCIYCDSRSLCYQMNHPFEDIEVKENAVELLEDVLRRKRKKCMIGTGSMTDPYMPLEQKLGNMRRALEVIRRYGFGVTVLTKSDGILRDLDLLQSIHEQAKCVVQMTLATYDEDLCRMLEPNVCTTARRFEVLKILRDAGIPTVVWMSPILPFLNDTPENIRGLLHMCTEAGVYGVVCFGMGLTLREGNREYFYSRLDRLFPGLTERYVRTYANHYEVSSPRSAELMELFHKICEERKIVHSNDRIFAYLSEFEEKNPQLSLFDT